jgi:hypothetical protein
MTVAMGERVETAKRLRDAVHDGGGGNDITGCGSHAH